MSQTPLLLTELPIPNLISGQLDKFTADAIHVQEMQSFSVVTASKQLARKEGSRVLAADFGGDKGIVRLFEVQDGSLVTIDGYEDDIQGDHGTGYVHTLQKAAVFAEVNKIPFGISWGGPLNSNGTLVPHPKATVFMNELQRYDQDLHKISRAISIVINDGPAGLLYSAVEAFKANGSTSVLFAINGGGLGFSVLLNDTVYPSEGGHVEGVAELNTYQQTALCGVYGAEYTCLELLGANKAGIEAQWQQITGKYARARDIEDMYKAGNKLAFELYDHSAFVMAHTIVGTAMAMNMDLSSRDITIACHGGAFKFPAYGERVKQLIETHSNSQVQLLLTKDYIEDKSNACLTGAAIAAICKS